MRFRGTLVLCSLLVPSLTSVASLRADGGQACVAAVEKADYQDALRQCRLAAEEGLAVGHFRLGWLYEHGLGVPGNLDQAASFYRMAAERGYSEAQNLLGRLYLNGSGVPENKAEAVKWYRMAADQGLAAAQVSLALMYCSGRGGLTQSNSEALRWLRMAVDQGDAQAQYNLGVMYKDGICGLPSEPIEAVKWFRKAAEKGYVAAQYNLGAVYASGLPGLPPNMPEAVMWYRKAAGDGSVKCDGIEACRLSALAQNNLAGMYYTGDGVAKDVPEALRLWRSAAEQGNALALTTLGDLSFRGEAGVLQDDAKAVGLYRRAADLGFAPAQKSLGLAYQQGRGVAKELVEAYMWYFLAASQGQREARQAIGGLTMALSEAQVAEAKRRAAAWVERPK